MYTCTGTLVHANKKMRSEFNLMDKSKALNYGGFRIASMTDYESIKDAQ